MIWTIYFIGVVLLLPLLIYTIRRNYSKISAEELFWCFVLSLLWIFVVPVALIVDFFQWLYKILSK